MRKFGASTWAVTSGLTAAVVIAFSCAPASATLYATRAAWDAAVPGASTIDFETPSTPNGFTFFGNGAGALYSAGGVAFTVSNDGNLFTVGPGFDSSQYGTTQVLSSQQASSGTSDLVIALPGAFNAVAFDFNTFDATSVAINLSNGDSFTEASVTGQPLAFFGDISSTPFTSLEITSGDFVFNIDNFSFGSSRLVAVPEPGSLILLSSALASLGLVRRRRKAA